MLLRHRATRLIKASWLAALVLVLGGGAPALSQVATGNLYDTGSLKPVDSVLKIKVGEPAPDFSLPSLSGDKVVLSQYRGKKNVLISFVPAAWTPVCSQQWPGYNIAKELFDSHDAVVIGISVDNLPTLHAWTQQMGDLWFPVASDFWPHGAVASQYGLLRSDGVSERALVLVDKQGIVRYIDVHDINTMTKLDELARALKQLPK